MARPNDGDSSYETSPYSWQFYETSPYSWQFQGRENLLSEYEILHSHSFRSLDTFKEVCSGFYRNLKEGNMTEGETQYLGFTHVRMSDMVNIDEIRSEIPNVRILYDPNEEILIMKFVMGVTHEMCLALLASKFNRLVQDQTGIRRSIQQLWGAGFQGLRDRMKEPDRSFKPSSRHFKTDWPSIVFEVAVCEGLTQLQQDARFWLECSGGQTRIVILVRINQGARSMVIQRWQHDASPSRQQPTQNTSVPNPYYQNFSSILVQSLNLEEGQVYAGASLIIPATLVYDILPRVQGAALGLSDFEITVEMLNSLNEDLWRRTLD